MHRALILALGTALCAAPIALAGPAAQGKAAAAKAGAYTAPRNAFGQPDLTGFWSNATLTPEQRPAALGDRAVYTPQEVAKLEGAVVKEVEEGNKPTDPKSGAEGGKVDPSSLRPEFAAAGGDVGGYNRGWLDPGSAVMRVRGEPRTGFLTTANGQPPPRKGGGGAGGYPRGMGSFDNPENRSLGERCIMGFGRNAGPPMLPNGFYNNNYQFVQTKDAFVIEVEMVHDTRVVRLNSPHRTDGERPWMGDSIGHWDGDTLVVETTNIPERQAYRGSWKNLKVTEKFTRVGKNHVLYQYTLDDPTMWDKPWGGEYEFAPLQGVIYEYACHEGNYALPGMLAGARNQEKDAAAGKSASAGPGASR
ncbi:MAG: hypothetical protein JWP28_1654 [Phenylobacterium sp.]|uniref:hypothetical protein n=1 Tax=Phenylobacterium sp. TaxID=1871053 RepID=UPI00261C6B21|nr:hypothetical protein [Phenylobacterium sp.]MDB5497623.1 hypothetical protein [Phenylobacterium sp.]